VHRMVLIVNGHRCVTSSHSSVFLFLGPSSLASAVLDCLPLGLLVVGLFSVGRSDVCESDGSHLTGLCYAETAAIWYWGGERASIKRTGWLPTNYAGMNCCPIRFPLEADLQYTCILD